MNLQEQGLEILLRLKDSSTVVRPWLFQQLVSIESYIYIFVIENELISRVLENFNISVFTLFYLKEYCRCVGVGVGVGCVWQGVGMGWVFGGMWACVCGCMGGVGVCGCGGVCVCVRPGIQSEDQNQFFTFKVRTF